MKLNREGRNADENMNPQKIMTSESIKKDEEADFELVPASQVTEKVSQQEIVRKKEIKNAVEIINNAIAGVVSLDTLKQCISLYKDTTPTKPNHTVTPTHIEPEQYNP
jgi:hypothetical protein